MFKAGDAVRVQKQFICTKFSENFLVSESLREILEGKQI